MNINFAINEGTSILKRNSIITAELDSELLMSKVMNKDRKNIILCQNKKLDPELYKNFKFLINQRKKRKPIAYLIGKKDFWKYQFSISEGVLIPRPDTEIIVDEALKIAKNKSNFKVLDIGLGSGCILFSILKEKKFFRGVGIDVSKKCIEIAKINALELGLLNRVKIIKSDVDNYNCGKYDLIISNPPYINKLDLNYLDKDIINFEPKIALNGGLDGLSVVRKVISKASKLIKKNGSFIIEIAFNQKNKIKNLLIKEGFYINKIVKDYAKNDRCIISTKT